MGPSNSSFLSFGVVFHFYDYGRKGTFPPFILSTCSLLNASRPQLWKLGEFKHNWGTAEKLYKSEAGLSGLGSRWSKFEKTARMKDNDDMSTKDHKRLTSGCIAFLNKNGKWDRYMIYIDIQISSCGWTGLHGLWKVLGLNPLNSNEEKSPVVLPPLAVLDHYTP